MAKEIERKFLLAEGTSIPIPTIHTKVKIRQGYISADRDKNVRIRIYDNSAVLGVKFTDTEITEEFEFVIPKRDGMAIYKRCDTRLEKKRLSFKRKNVRFDIDTYPNGIIVVEAEFESIKQMENWEKPHWIGEDVSGQSEYSNVVLAKQNLVFNDGN